MGTKCNCRQSEYETVDAPRRPAEPQRKKQLERKHEMTKKLMTMLFAAAAMALGAWAEMETVGG